MPEWEEFTLPETSFTGTKRSAMNINVIKLPLCFFTYFGE